MIDKKLDKKFVLQFRISLLTSMERETCTPDQCFFLGLDLKLGRTILGSNRKKIGLGDKFLKFSQNILKKTPKFCVFSKKFSKECVFSSKIFAPAALYFFYKL